MRVGVIGINHKQAPIELREALVQAYQRRFKEMRINCSIVLLSTCNRIEIYFSSKNLTESHSTLLQLLQAEVDIPFEQLLYSFFGVECFSHLTRVTVGLDSAIRGETEIQGQVSKAYQQAIECGSLTGELHFIFQKALQIGKQIRHTYLSQQSTPTLEQILWQNCRKYIEKPCEHSILCVGASETNRKIITYLKNRDCKRISILNRTWERGKAMAESLNITLVPWDKKDLWHQYDVVICATTAQAHLLEWHDAKTVTTQIAFDLSVPRNIDPVIGRITRLLDIDDLHQGLVEQNERKTRELAIAYAQIQTSVEKHTLLWLTKTTKPQTLFSVA